MASTSSSSSVHHKYDVFLSFRGEDTRHSFTDHLYDALLRAGLRIFRDNDAIDRGEQLKPEIEKAILESRASIVVLSENYANSRWCLDELVLILEQGRNFNHYALPVFYHVLPSDVRNQRQSFKIKGGSTCSEVKDVNSWKSALTEVADLTGMVVSGSEAEFIKNIIETIYHKLDLKHLSAPAYLTGMSTRAEGIISWLRTDEYSAEALAICGMGGIGKTTLVLIVLDDIDDQEQISALLGTKTLHTKSKVIITTRHLDIRSWFRSTSCKCQVYKLKLLNDDESLELLSFHAFGTKDPMEDFKDLAVRFAQYCEGNPLALEVLGSSLYVNAEDPYETERCINDWISTMNSLNSLTGQDLDDKIMGILKRSYDSLPRRSHRELFLHIAFFFVGEYEDDVVQILERDWHAQAGIKTLINRCLLTVSSSKKLMMHQLLQEMGRRIVYEESKDPAKRSRVCQDESYRVLEKGEGSQTVEGLALDMRKIEQGMGSEQHALKTYSLAKMDKLKLLQLKYVELIGSFKNFPELTWLCWHECNLKTISSGLMMSSLVAIDMSYGKLEEFEVPKGLYFLKTLNLKGCWNLATVRHLDRMPNLEALILWDCTSLTHICKTIARLKNLTSLDLTGCKNLMNVSSKKKLVNQLQKLKALGTRNEITEQRWLTLPNSLQFLFLNNFDLEKLKHFRVVFSGHPYFYINLGNNLFKYLPSNIDLNMLRVLNLTSCHCLKSLVCLPSTLEELYTYSCESLEKITFQSGSFRLREFGYTRCFELCEIQGLIKLVFIDNTDEAELGHLSWIKAFENETLELVGDEITDDRRQNIQMLYEYGIMSTYLGQVEADIMISEYMSESPFVSFDVPYFCPNQGKIQGLKVNSEYYSLLKYEDQDECVLFAKVCIRNKGLTWIYNPVVYGKPRTDKDTVWLSYWPIGNMLDPGDEVDVSIIMGNGLIVSRCGASLVYMDDEFQQSENKTAKGEEVIGGDLSEFELTTGVYYLCRRDLFSSTSPDWLQMLLGDDTIHYTELQGWRKFRQLHHSSVSFRELKTFRGALYQKVVVRVIFRSESEKRKVLKAVSNITGVESIAFDVQTSMMTIIGQMDPVTVVILVRESGNFAELLVVGPC